MITSELGVFGKIEIDSNEWFLEFDHLNLDAYAKLGAALPGAEIVDIGQATMRMRLSFSRFANVWRYLLERA